MNIRQPDAPFLEYNFYRRDSSNQENFLRFVNSLQKLGAEFTGKGYVHDLVSDTSMPKGYFANINDQPVWEYPIHSIDDVLQVMNNPNIRLVQLEFINVDILSPDIISRLTYLPVSEKAQKIDNHPIALWTDGSEFSMPENEDQIYKLGMKAYELFKKLIKEMNPLYAAITSEWGLECLFDIYQNRKSYSFTDFYLNCDTPDKFFTKSKVVESLDKFDLYIEDLFSGIYISTYPGFNKFRQNSMKISEEVSLVISELISYQSKSWFR